MNKRGRPRLAADRRTNGVRVVVRPHKALAHDIRLYAAYHGKSLQTITREWWEFLISRADEKKIDFRGASKNN